MDPEEIFNDLDDAHEAMMKEQELIRQTQNLLEVKIKEAIHEIYPGDIYRLSAEGYMLLENLVFKHISDLAVDATDLFYNHTE